MKTLKPQTENSSRLRGEERQRRHARLAHTARNQSQEYPLNIQIASLIIIKLLWVWLIQSMIDCACKHHVFRVLFSEFVIAFI